MLTFKTLPSDMQFDVNLKDKDNISIPLNSSDLVYLSAKLVDENNQLIRQYDLKNFDEDIYQIVAINDFDAIITIVKEDMENYIKKFIFLKINWGLKSTITVPDQISDKAQTIARIEVKLI